MGITTRRKFVRRFELFEEYYDNTASFESLNKQQRLAMNYILSLMTTVNHQLSEIQYWNLIRLYFIKCFKGRAQALGKPSNGQRTWSNAWTAYNYNKTIRQFVNKVQTKLNQEKREEKINYKLVRKKFKKNKNDGLLKQPKKKPSSWF
jgi:ribosomal protein S13